MRVLIFAILFVVQAWAVPETTVSGLEMSGSGMLYINGGKAHDHGSTDQVGEGSANLYFTDARAIAAVTGKEPAITAGTTLQYWRGDKTWQTLSTSVVPESGSNKYYATSLFNADLATKSTSNLSEGSNLYYTTARVDGEFDIRLATKSTTNLAEGTNLYFTNGRAQSAISASSPITYSGGTVGCQTASGSQAGCLSSANWTTFNNKLTSIVYTATTTTRALNTNFTPSATKAVFVTYSVLIQAAATLAVGGTGKVELRSDTNATPTTVRSTTSNDNSVSISLLTLSNNQTVPLTYLVPPGHNVRLVTSGNATISIVSQTEVSIDIQ